jgi:hypothetical protein
MSFRLAVLSTGIATAVLIASGTGVLGHHKECGDGSLPDCPAPAVVAKPCLKAKFRYHSCPFGDQFPRYGHPADDDGPWWIGSYTAD